MDMREVKKDGKVIYDGKIFKIELDTVICPNKKELTLDGAYPAPQEKGGGNKIKLIYSNYQACKKCKDKKTCYKTNHRTITRYVQSKP